MPIPFEPVFALSPAQVEPAEVDILGAVFLVSTTGLLLVHEAEAMSLQLSPEQILAVGTVMVRLARQLGADPMGAASILAAAPTWQGAPYDIPAG